MLSLNKDSTKALSCNTARLGAWLHKGRGQYDIARRRIERGGRIERGSRLYFAVGIVTNVTLPV